ncbi:MAG: hypothetical protein ABI353_01565, partial [Isosphaeraceae bacterium]
MSHNEHSTTGRRAAEIAVGDSLFIIKNFYVRAIVHPPSFMRFAVHRPTLPPLISLEDLGHERMRVQLDSRKMTNRKRTGC